MRLWLWFCVFAVAVSGQTVQDNYALRDTFSALNTNLVNVRNANGRGAWYVTDSSNRFSVSSGRLNMTGNSVWGDPGLVTTGLYSRLPGRGFFATGYKATAGNFRMGWKAVTNSATLISDALSGINGNNIGVWPISATTEYRMGVIFRGVRGYCVVVSGGVYPEGSLLQVYNAPLHGSYHASIANFSFDGYVKDALIQDLNGKWNTDGCFGIATNYIAAPTNDVIVAGWSNGTVAVHWQVKTGETNVLRFRQSDASNYMALHCDPVSGRMVTMRMSNGVEFLIRTNAGAFTIGTGYYLTARINGNSIQPTINGIFVTASTDSFNNTAIGIGTSGGTTNQDLVMWPLTVSMNPKPTRVPSQVKVWAYCDSRLTTGENPRWMGKMGFMRVLPQEGNCLAIPDSIQHAAGFTVASGVPSLQVSNVMAGDLVTASSQPPPDYIIFLMAVNDAGPTNAAFFANYLKALDDMNAAYPAAKIYCNLPWSTNAAMSIWNEKAHAITNFVASRSSFARVGLDERVVVENGDNGASYTTDGLHYNEAGHIMMARAFKALLGL